MTADRNQGDRSGRPGPIGPHPHDRGPADPHAADPYADGPYADGRACAPHPAGHERARATARATARGTARGVRGGGRASGRAGRFAVVSAQRAANAQGADRSGLNRLIYVCAANSAGDAAVAISLATTVFFAGATSGQRSQVALFLALTMVPFAIVAPVIGPFLDRFSYGRRWAMGTTMVVRAVLCLVLAGTVQTTSVWFYASALGVLVSSKAFDVTRAAAVPRLLPAGLSLVKANGRLSLAGVVAVAVTGPVAALAITLGPSWCLGFACVVFVVASVACVRLPGSVDSAVGEVTLRLGGPRRPRRGTRIPSRVAFALRANCGPRFLSGFLTMFLTFLLTQHSPADWHHEPRVLVALVVGSVGAGTTIAILVTSVLRRIGPAAIVVVALLGDLAAVLFATVAYGSIALVVLGLTAGLMQQLAKVALDSSIQSAVPERAQSSAFARSNATLQVVWVLGGFVGIALPLIAHLGLGVAAAVVLAWTVYVLLTRPRRLFTTPASPVPGL